MAEGFTIPEYKTILSAAEETLIIKKSKFIASVAPVNTVDEAIAFLEETKKKHWNATHNCSAYVIGEQNEIQKASDDGEPSGTAGKPMLEVLKKEEIKNVAVVVTRYFGGILLGAGGLIRAYSQATSEGLHKAGIVQKILHTEIFATVDYTWVGKLENELHAKGYPVTGMEYTDQVRFTILANVGEEEALEELLTNVVNGQVFLNRGDCLYVNG